MRYDIRWGGENRSDVWVLDALMHMRVEGEYMGGRWTDAGRSIDTRGERNKREKPGAKEVIIWTQMSSRLRRITQGMSSRRKMEREARGEREW